jgi:hypothetical protein
MVCRFVVARHFFFFLVHDKARHSPVTTARRQKKKKKDWGCAFAVRYRERILYRSPTSRQPRRPATARTPEAGGVCRRTAAIGLAFFFQENSRKK